MWTHTHTNQTSASASSRGCHGCGIRLQLQGGLTITSPHAFISSRRFAHLEGELLWQGGDGEQVGQGGHDDGGDDELHLQGVLDLADGLGRGDVGGQEGGGNADDDANSAANQGATSQ